MLGDGHSNRAVPLKFYTSMTPPVSEREDNRVQVIFIIREVTVSGVVQESRRGATTSMGGANY